MTRDCRDLPAPPPPQASLGLILGLAGLLAPPAAARVAAGDGGTSIYWGRAGEKWKPDGPLMDFSYAGTPGWGIPCLPARGLVQPWARAQAAAPSPRRPPTAAQPPPGPPPPPGYKSSDAALPRPPPSKSLEDFQKGGRSDSEALAAAVEWANSRPRKDGGWGLPGPGTAQAAEGTQGA